MANVSSVKSDDDNANGSPQKVAALEKKSVEPMDVDEKVGIEKEASEKEASENDASDNDNENESEYEIEEILDAKRGSFPEGRMGYFVRWKGYGPEENSWVDEQDAGNATALIEEYWKKNPKKARKSETKTPKRGWRKSGAAEETEVSTKKRGRKSQASQRAGGESADNAEIRAKKKARKSIALEDEEVPSDEENVYCDMNQYLGVIEWDSMVKTVDTIEREGDGSLMVYFTLYTGEHAREKSSLCRQRFPQKLISFYENNLRWKTTQEQEVENS